MCKLKGCESVKQHKYYALGVPYRCLYRTSMNMWNVCVCVCVGVRVHVCVYFCMHACNVCVCMNCVYAFIYLEMGKDLIFKLPAF